MSERNNTIRYIMHWFSIQRSCVLRPAEGSVSAAIVAMSWILDFLGVRFSVMLNMIDMYAYIPMRLSPSWGTI
jgi:hypothetical protein